MRRNIAGIIIRRLVGLLIFFVLLGGFNIFANLAQISELTMWVGFFNSTARLLVFFTIIFLFGDLFEAFDFPFSIPFPLFNAYGSILVISFIFQIISFAVSAGQGLYNSLTDLMIIISAIVAIITLISGYARIFSREIHMKYYDEDEYLWRERRRHKRTEGKTEKVKKDKSNASDVEWHDVGNEFKGMLYDAFHGARESMKKKK